MLGDNTRASTDGAPCAVAVAPLGFAERRDPIATIGVAYDGSAESRAALEIARALAIRTGAQIRARHIISIASYDYTTVGTVVLDDINKRVADADSQMKSLQGVDGRAEYGLPGPDLETFSDDVDLLIVGSRGYGPWGRLVHGSTSAQLARHARGPLLIVPRMSGRAVADESAGARPATVGA
jgi:nucleotide-binding universal stress UspA family protein